MAYRILVPRPGIEPGPPAVEAWSPNHLTTREFPPHDQFMIKECNSGKARWTRCIGQGVKKGLGASMPSAVLRSPKSPRVHPPGSPQNPSLLGFYKGFITSARVMKSLTVDNRQSPGWRPWRPAQTPYVLAKSHLTNISKAPLSTLITYEISRVLGALCPKNGNKDQTCFLL